MHFAVICLVALCGIAHADDDFVVNKLPFYQIKPFPEVEPDCRINEIALQFKPQLRISSGCRPYPAVDENGFISNGLGVSHLFTDCDGSPEGSQVYGRAHVYKGYLAIMYAWYFPSDLMLSPVYIGHRHGWEHVVLYFGNSTKDPTLLAVAAKSMVGYRTYEPPESKHMSGDSFKLKYTSMLVAHHYLTATREPGEYQDLIMWNNMTAQARASLKPKSWSQFKPPISDDRFFKALRDSYPF